MLSQHLFNYTVERCRWRWRWCCRSLSLILHSGRFQTKHPQASRRPSAKQMATVLATTTPPLPPPQARRDCARLTARTSATTTVKATTPARKRFLSHFLLPSGSFLLAPLEASGHRILSKTFHRIDNGGRRRSARRHGVYVTNRHALLAGTSPFISRRENAHSPSRDILTLHKRKL